MKFRYMDLDEVLRSSPCRSKSALYAAIKNGEAPPPDRIGGRSLWRSDFIEAWILRAAEEADAERARRSEQGAAIASRMLRGRHSKA